MLIFEFNTTGNGQRASEGARPAGTRTSGRQRPRAFEHRKGAEGGLGVVADAGAAAHQRPEGHERRRVVAGSMAKALGRGGKTAVAEASGMSRNTVELLRVGSVDDGDHADVRHRLDRAV